MMQQKGLFRYAKGPDFAVVALPYVDNRFAMYCFLPDKGVDALVAELKNFFLVGSLPYPPSDARISGAAKI